MNKAGEELVEGDEYRFLVVGGRVVAVSKRMPASVVGDGDSSITKLIEEKNKIRSRSRAHRKMLIQVNDNLLSCIDEVGMNLRSVPDEGVKVFLNKTSNISIGGDSEDVTESVDESFVSIAEEIWQVYGDRAIYGVDLICSDITKPAEEVGYGVIEVNNRPSALLHGSPTIGKGRQVGKKIIDYVFG